MTHVSDVVVIGGGVIGLATAWRLARIGTHVTVLDAGRTLQPGQASWAAAGMLAPLAESHTSGPLVNLGLDSLHRYPAFLNELGEDTNSPIELLGPGMLRVARTEQEVSKLSQVFSWQRSLGLPLEWVTENVLRQMEPSLAEDVQAAIHSPLEKHVPPRQLLTALRLACRRRGVCIKRGFQASSIVAHELCAKGVRVGETEFSCNQILVTTGAWADHFGINLPSRPIRGQAVMLGSVDSSLITHTLYGSEGYLVPRPGGVIFAGATEEDVGYESRTTYAGRTAMRQMASHLVPALTAAKQKESWAGLRPVMADGLPVIGRIGDWENVYFAGGHGRNGILLTPITATLMMNLMRNKTPPPPAFDPGRFGGNT